MTVTLPVTLPVAAGAKVTFRVALWPAVRTCPTEVPLTLNPGPEMLTLEIVTLEFPEFVSFAESVLLLPTLTLPKLKADTFALSR